MKGISHFITGVALATFFPQVVQAGAQGSLLPMLGGIGGILPDTLDFKFARYFEDYSAEIDPGPDPDPGTIADALVDSMRRAYEEGESQNVMLHTIRLGADLWREYAIRFDPENGQVAVRIGPLVNTGQVPYPGTEPDGMAQVRRKLGVPLVNTYSSEYRVNIFSGPSFRFAREGDKLYVHFLDWHRRWSHSLTLAAAVGLVTWLLFGKWAGVVAGLGFAAHILEDQLGFMGSNLFYPFTKKRTTGLQLLRSGDAIPNFLTVWISVLLILFNLDRFSGQPLLNPWWFLGLAVVLPVVVLGGLYQHQRRRGKPESKESLRQRDILSEAEDVEIG
ncbi:MAG: metal-dependent hydrolase [Chloroflexota bacterium]|nr:metal-dependent hydrolase [Chloroflexota bacterium]